MPSEVHRSESGKLGVCKCYWSWVFWLRVWGKTHFEKTAFKDIDYKIPHILQDITGDRVKINNRYQHETSPVNYLH